MGSGGKTSVQELNLAMVSHLQDLCSTSEPQVARFCDRVSLCIYVDIKFLEMSASVKSF